MSNMAVRTGPMRLSDMVQTYWQGVVYGPPGCGKTTFATFSTLNTFVYDVDIGVNTTMAFRRKMGMPLDNCVVWQIRTIADFDAATKWLEANIRNFGLVVVDSATELQRLIIRETSEKSKHLAPDQREWGVVRTLSENLTVKFRYMPVHLVYSCHEVNKWDADYEREVYRPSFDGRFAFEYARHFSWIARLVAVQVPTGAINAMGKPEVSVVRALNFGPDPFIHFKDRSGAMQQWEVPHLDTLLQRMIASTAADPVPQQYMIQQEAHIG